MNKQAIITIMLALFGMATYGQTDSTKTKKRELWQSAQPKADICP